MKWLYHAARIVFGGWWLFSGLMHFLWPDLQPLGDEQPAINFTLALMASGLFDWIKVIEVVLGVLFLAGRAMPLALIALVPINVVIVYWEFRARRGCGRMDLRRALDPVQRGAALAVARLFLALVRVAGRSDHSARPFPEAPG